MGLEPQFCFGVVGWAVYVEEGVRSVVEVDGAHQDALAERAYAARCVGDQPVLQRFTAGNGPGGGERMQAGGVLRPGGGGAKAGGQIDGHERCVARHRQERIGAESGGPSQPAENAGKRSAAGYIVGQHIQPETRITARVAIGRQGDRTVEPVQDVCEQRPAGQRQQGLVDTAETSPFAAGEDERDGCQEAMGRTTGIEPATTGTTNRRSTN